MSQINIKIPDDLLKQIDDKRKQLYISRSAYIIMALSQKIQADEMLKSLPELQQALNSIEKKLPTKTDD